MLNQKITPLITHLPLPRATSYDQNMSPEIKNDPKRAALWFKHQGRIQDLCLRKKTRKKQPKRPLAKKMLGKTAKEWAQELGFAKEYIYAIYKNGKLEQKLRDLGLLDS